MSLIINHTILYVKDTLQAAEAGHDWFHIQRVYKNAMSIASTENCNLLVVQLASLLHDIADHKFHNGDETIGPAKAKAFLTAENVDQTTIDQVVQIIQNLSFKGGLQPPKINSIEFQIVQDADRLDAIGAIGIARTFHYGGYKNRPLYDPNINPVTHTSSESYKQSTAPTINHFYEKLLLLKSQMHTQKAKQKAEKRHAFMEQFLSQFYDEWETNN